jgi:hypothetical protein
MLIDFIFEIKLNKTRHIDNRLPHGEGKQALKVWQLQRSTRMFCSKIFLVSVRSPVGSVRYRLTTVIESPTKLGATTENTLAVIVKTNPSTRRVRYLKRYLLRYCNARNGLKFFPQR